VVAINFVLGTRFYGRFHIGYLFLLLCCWYASLHTSITLLLVMSTTLHKVSSWIIHGCGLNKPANSRTVYANWQGPLYVALLSCLNPSVSTFITPVAVYKVRKRWTSCTELLQSETEVVQNLVKTLFIKLVSINSIEKPVLCRTTLSNLSELKSKSNLFWVIFFGNLSWKVND